MSINIVIFLGCMPFSKKHTSANLYSLRKKIRRDRMVQIEVIVCVWKLFLNMKFAGD